MDRKFFSDLKSDLKQDFNKLGFGAEKAAAPPANAALPASAAPKPAGSAAPTGNPTAKPPTVNNNNPTASPQKQPPPPQSATPQKAPQQQQQQQQAQQSPQQQRAASDASAQSGRAQKPETAEKEGGSTFGGLSMLSPFSKGSGDQQEKDKSSSSGLFSVDLLGGKGGKAKEAAAQSDQELSRLRRELIERDQRIEALSENLKLMVTSQENLERQIEMYKMKARDAPLISTAMSDSDRIHELELKLMEQQENLFQANEANKKLRKSLQNGGGQASFSQDAVTELQHEIEQLFDQAHSRMPQHGSDSNLLIQPAAEPLLSFSQPAPDPFDLLGLNDVQAVHPPSNTASHSPNAPKAEQLKQLQAEVTQAISRALSAARQATPQGNLLDRVESADVSQSAHSDEFVENLKSQIEMWKETAQKRAEALAHSEISMSEKIAGIQKMFDEEMIFKDAEIANLRKLTVSKLDDKKDYEHQYKTAADQLNKMSLNLQDVSAELTRTLQENQRLQSKSTTLESTIRDLESSHSGIAEQSQGNQKRLAASESEMAQKNEQINTLKTSLETTRSTLNAMSAKSNALREEKKELNDRYTEALEKLSSLEKLATSRKQDADTLSREKDSILNKYHGEVSKLEALTKSSKAEADQLRAEKAEAVEAVKKEVAEMEAKVDSISRELRSSNETVVSLRQQVSALEANLEEKDAQIQEMKATHAAEIAKLTESVAQFETEVAQLKEDKEKDLQSIEELQNRLDGFEAEKRNSEKKSAQLIKDLKKQLAQERKGNPSGASGKDSEQDTRQDGRRHSEEKESSSDVQMKDDLDNLVIKVTNLQSEIMDLKRKNKGLQENVEVLRADNEAKSKIVQEYLLKEKVGIIHTSPVSSPQKEAEHKSKLANIASIPGNLVHLPSNLSNLSPLTSKKKSSAQLENAMGNNKKLQDVVEETMMKNMQLQELIKNMGDEIEILKGQLKAEGK